MYRKIFEYFAGKMSFWFMAIKWEGIPHLIPNWTVNKKAFNLYSFFGFATERLLHIYCNSGSRSCCCSSSSSSSCPCCCCCCCGAFLWKLKNHNARANGFPTPAPLSLSLSLHMCSCSNMQPHGLRQHGTMTPKVPLPHGTSMSRCEEFCFCIFYTHTHT